MIPQRRAPLQSPRQSAVAPPISLGDRRDEPICAFVVCARIAG